MYYAYVIKSEVADFLYKGHCEDLNKRLKEHNSGYTESIKKFIPFRVAYFEIFSTRNDAIQREKYFKTAAGRRYLKSKMVP